MKTFDLAQRIKRKLIFFIFSDEMAVFAQANRLVYFDSVKGESGAANYTSGDNCGYIYSSSTVENSADDFLLKAGESVLVVPRQPEDYGPWPVFPMEFFNGSIWKKANSMGFMCVLVTNRWSHKVIHVRANMLLSELLVYPGIGHVTGFVPESHLTRMANYTLPNRMNRNLGFVDQERDDDTHDVDDDDTDINHARSSRYRRLVLEDDDDDDNQVNDYQPSPDRSTPNCRCQPVAPPTGRRRPKY
jgi:hypothetical protein